MSTRATIYVHWPRCTKPTSKYMVKLYQHCDWYEDWLGIALIRWFQDMKNYWQFDYCLKKSNWYHQNRFELTNGNHGDTEYMYHIYINRNWVKITYQTGDYSDEYLIELPEHLILSKEFNWKKFIEASLEEKIEWRELYHIKQYLEWQEVDKYYSEYLFSRRYEIYNFDSFNNLISEDKKAFKDLWEREDIEANQKYEIEDVILKNIKNTIIEEKRLEEHQYFRHSI